MNHIEIRTPRLTLREFDESDLDALLSIVSDDRITQWMSFDSRSRQQAKDILDGVLERASNDPRVEYYFPICRGGEVIGTIRLGINGVRAAKLGYMIRPEYQGMGFAVESATALIDYGFSSLDRHRISAAIGPENLRSIAVAKRLGMHYEGRIRDHVFTNGAWRDSLLYSVLVDEWSKT